MATHIIGDIHGCYRELCELLEILGPTADDRLIFVGALVIRGPENASVVRMFLDERLPNATVLLGNNEEKIRPTLAGDPTYASPAVLETIRQLNQAGLLDAALRLFESFPLFADLGDTLVLPHTVGLDTGCVYGGKLTALTLETGAFTSVRAAETYYRHPGKWYLFV